MCDVFIEHALGRVGRAHVDFPAGGVGDALHDVRIDAHAIVHEGGEGGGHVPQRRFDRAERNGWRHEGVALGHVGNAEAAGDVGDARGADFVGDFGGDSVD